MSVTIFWRFNDLPSPWRWHGDGMSQNSRRGGDKKWGGSTDIWRMPWIWDAHEMRMSNLDVWHRDPVFVLVSYRSQMYTCIWDAHQMHIRCTPNAHYMHITFIWSKHQMHIKCTSNTHQMQRQMHIKCKSNANQMHSMSTTKNNLRRKCDVRVPGRVSV